MTEKNKDQAVHAEASVVSDALNSQAGQAIITSLFDRILKALGDLLRGHREEMQAQHQANQIPDDPPRTVSANLVPGLAAEEPESGVLSIQKAIYTDAQGRDQGLVESERVQGALRGTHNMPRQSRVVFDLTLFDVDGHPSGEITPAEVRAQNLQFSQRIRFVLLVNGKRGFWQGRGANKQQKSTISPDGFPPNPGYDQVEPPGSFVGFGYRAWEYAQGFLFPTQIDGEGDVEVFVEYLTPDFKDVMFETNHLTFKTS